LAASVSAVERVGQHPRRRACWKLFNWILWILDTHQIQQKPAEI
jgi:hypothetical protein